MRLAKNPEALEEHGIDLNALFRDLIDRTGKTTYAIAAELGVSQSSLTRPYNGERVPSLELICRVGTVAGMQVKIELKKRRNRTG